jgi:predicted metalloprotease
VILTLALSVLAPSALAGCAPGTPASPPPAAIPAATPPPKPPPPCASQADDLPFATCLLKDLDQVWTRELQATGRTYTAPRLTVGDGPGAPADRTRDDGPDRAFFNPRSGIHLPTRYLAAVHAAAGPRAHLDLTFTISHETGHHIQSLLHPRVDVRVNDREAQADCYAGVWAHQEAADGKLDTEQFRAASAEELTRLSTYPDEVPTHGDPAQRLASLDKGLRSGDPAACDVGPLTWR